jgi:hypothetical protein
MQHVQPWPGSQCVAGITTRFNALRDCQLHREPMLLNACKPAAHRVRQVGAHTFVNARDLDRGFGEFVESLECYDAQRTTVPATIHKACEEVSHAKWGIGEGPRSTLASELKKLAWRVRGSR